MKFRIALCALLYCLPVFCIGKSWSNLSDPSAMMSDTIKKKTRKSRHELPDTVSVSYDNGKFSGPSNLSRGDLTQLGRKESSGLLGKWRERRRAKKQGKANGDKEKVSGADSLLDVGQNASTFVRQLKPRTQFSGARINSDKKIKELYDSAGFNGKDTLLALARIRKPVSEDELLAHINSSVRVNNLSNPGENLSKMKLKDEALRELSPLSGRSIRPDVKQAGDTLLGKIFEYANIDSAAIPDSVSRLRGAKIVPFRSLKELDSLKSVHNGSDSVVYLSKAKADSIKIAWLHAVQLKQKRFHDRVYLTNDSLTNLRTHLHKHSLNERAVFGKLSEIPIPTKNGFFDRFYFEGMVSFNRTSIQDEIRLSPGIGFLITSDFSIGAGLNVLIARKERQINVLTGYRLFSKYQFFKQRAYVQIEDWVDPARRTGEGNKPLSQHSILAGGGYVLAIGKSLGINGAIFYRLNNERYSDGLASPWVFRIGISSIRSKHK